MSDLRSTTKIGTALSKSGPMARPPCDTSRSPRNARSALGRFTSGFVVALFALTLLTASVATAKSWGYDLASELMSPYCPGRTLASCPSPQAAELVQWMVLQEAAGSSQEEVIAILIERFGEEILGAPPAKGITLWAYIFPILGFVLGGGLVVIALRRMVAAQSTSTSTLPADSPDSALSDLATGVRSAGSVTSTPTPTDAPEPGDANSERRAATDDELARRVDADLAARA